MKKILIVEDDLTIQNSLNDLLGQQYEIIQAFNVKEVRELIKNNIDLIIMDIQLPDGNGIFLSEEIRANYETPILFLSCKNDENTIVEALRLGDDYVIKPFENRILIARIEAILRRIPVNQEIIMDKDIILNKKTYEVFQNQKLLDIKNIYFDLMLILLENQGIVITRSRLLDLIEERTGHIIEDNTLTVHMKKLRTTLGLYQQKSYIETIRGVGYRWIK